MPESKNSTNVLAFIRAVLHHWLALMGGGAITVALGLFERFSGKNVPLWVYVCVLVFFVFFACYLAWRDARKAVTQGSLNEQKRQFLAGRLQSLLNEAGTAEGGYIPLDPIGMEKISRAMAYDDRAKNFVKQHYGTETASRYDEEKSNLLESLLADCYKDEPGALTVIQKSIDKRD